MTEIEITKIKDAINQSFKVDEEILFNDIQLAYEAGFKRGVAYTKKNLK